MDERESCNSVSSCCTLASKAATCRCRSATDDEYLHRLPQTVKPFQRNIIILQCLEDTLSIGLAFSSSSCYSTQVTSCGKRIINSSAAS